MAFNINEFKSSIEANGLLKTNRFRVRMPMPTGFAGNPDIQSYTSTNRMLEFWCEASSIPGVALATHPILRYGYGAIEKRPFTPQFTDINLTFLADGQSAIWTFFQQWIKMVYNFDMRQGIAPGDQYTGQVGGIRMEPYEMSYRDEYIVDVAITVFDDSGEPAKIVVLREAYPVFMGDINVNWMDNNNIMRVPVSFTFVDWYNERVELYGENIPNS